MDYYRMPKTSFYLFKSQNDPDLKVPGVATGPMVYIANCMTPFSDKDLTVYTNCEKVRMHLPDGTTIEGEPEKIPMKHPPVIFKNAFKWGNRKNRVLWDSPTPKTKDSGKYVAEGLIGGQVVVQSTRQVASRVDKIELEVDDRSVPLVADGCDFVGIHTYFVDFLGNRRVLARNVVNFTVEGEGSILGDKSIQANPFVSQFGSAVAFIKTTTRPGKIKVTTTTLNMGKATITLESQAPTIPLLHGIATETKVKAKSSGITWQGTAGSDMSEEEF